MIFKFLRPKENNSYTNKLRLINLTNPQVTIFDNYEELQSALTSQYSDRALIYVERIQTSPMVDSFTIKDNDTSIKYILESYPIAVS